MDNRGYQAYCPTYNISQDHNIDPPRPRRRRSPATRVRSWRRAIAWRRQMGFLPPHAADTEGETLPSLLATDIVQQQYLGAAEYIDQLCSYGALAAEDARPLRRCLLDWTLLQINMLQRIEELESELLDTNTQQIDTNVNPDDMQEMIDTTYTLDTHKTHNTPIQVNTQHYQYSSHHQNTKAPQKYTSSIDQNEEKRTLILGMIKQVEEVEKDIETLERIKLKGTTETHQIPDKLTYKNMLRRLEDIEKDFENFKASETYPNNDKHESQSENETDNETKVYYNVDKCKNKIKPVTFVSGGFINTHHTQPNTTHNTHETFQEAPVTPTPPDTPMTDFDKMTETSTSSNDIRTDKEADNNRNTAKLTHKDNEMTDSDTDEDKPGGASYDYNCKTMIENAKLSRLENQHTFQAALRLVTRLMHPKGAKVCYPIAEQTDRLVLRALNMPTDGPGLCDILRKACSRRGESFNLDAVYQDMARAHGRVYFDPTLAGPKCMVFTHYP